MAKRENFWAGHYGMDLFLEPTRNDQKGGVAHFASTGAPTVRKYYCWLMAGMRVSTQKKHTTPELSRENSGLDILEWTCIWNRLEIARKAVVPTSQVLMLLQFEDVIDGLWLELKLVPRGSSRHPGLRRGIFGLATMEWTCVRNRLEMARKAGVPTS